MEKRSLPAIVPGQLHIRLKKHCAEQNITMQAFIQQAVLEKLQRGEYDE